MQTNRPRAATPVLETLESRTLCSATTLDGYQGDKDIGPVVFFDNGQHEGQGRLPSHEVDAHALDGLTTAGLVEDGIPK